MGLVLEGQVLETRVTEKGGKVATILKVLTNGGGPVGLMTVYCQGAQNFKEGQPFRGYMAVKDDFLFFKAPVEGEAAGAGKRL